MTPLTGHTSQETAYLVEDYPYGGLRCRIKFWIEHNKTRGYRFVSQTQNPKTGRWNNPRLGTYCMYGMAMYLDDKNHVQHTSLSGGSSADDVLSFLKNFPDATPSFELKTMVATRYRMTERTAKGEANFKIGGVPQKPSEHDIERAKTELTKWVEAIELLKGKN